jgi:hypothetical protein
MRSIALILISGLSLHSGTGCDEAEYAAGSARTYARRAYYATTLDDARYNAKKAMNFATDLESAASDCRCADAESAAVDVYRYSRRAYLASSLRESQDYARKAMRLAEDAELYAADCG